MPAYYYQHLWDIPLSLFLYDHENTISKLSKCVRPICLEYSSRFQSPCVHITQPFSKSHPMSVVVQIKVAFLCSLCDSGLLISSPCPNFERLPQNLASKYFFENDLRQQMFLFKHKNLCWQFQNELNTMTKHKQKEDYFYIKVLQVAQVPLPTFQYSPR